MRVWIVLMLLALCSHSMENKYFVGYQDGVFLGMKLSENDFIQVLFKTNANGIDSDDDGLRVSSNSGDEELDSLVNTESAEEIKEYFKVMLQGGKVILQNQLAKLNVLWGFGYDWSYQYSKKISEDSEPRKDSASTSQISQTIMRELSQHQILLEIGLAPEIWLIQERLSLMGSFKLNLAGGTRHNQSNTTSESIYWDLRNKWQVDGVERYVFDERKSGFTNRDASDNLIFSIGMSGFDLTSSIGIKVYW